MAPVYQSAELARHLSHRVLRLARTLAPKHRVSSRLGGGPFVGAGWQLPWRHRASVAQIGSTLTTFC